MKKAPVIIRGQHIGRLRASWLLFKESWRFFRADPEMVWIPLLFSIVNLVLLAFILGVGVVAVMAVGLTEAGEVPDYLWYTGLFGVYVAAAFTFALSQAAVVNTVSIRAHGGNATFGDSVRVAFSYAGTLFFWALITSTVGIILRYIAERSQLLGRIVTTLIGVAWSVLTYFVVTAVVLEKQTAVPAIKRSGSVFRATWGETFVSNISLGLVFILAHVVAILVFVGCIVAATVIGLTAGYVFAVVILIVWFFVATLVYEVLQAVLKTLLYMYATEETVPTNFDHELLDAMLVRQNPAFTHMSNTTVSFQKQ